MEEPAFGPHCRRREPFRRRQRWLAAGGGTGGPLRRDPQGRLAGGLASGLASWRGFNVITVRIVLVLVTLISTGAAAAVYVVAWLLIPAAGADSSIWSKARTDARGVALATGVASLLTVVLLAAGVFGEGWLAGSVWPQVVSAAGLVLLWRNAPSDEQAVLRRLVGPLGAAAGAAVTGSGRRTGTVIRLAAAAVLLIAGVAGLLSERESLALLRPLGGAILLLAAVVLLLGPWWLRIARDVVVERQARIRAEERADIAAQVHDSVLQTLALIQRRADDPHQVIQLARAQERELRGWLFEGRAPGETGGATFAAGIRLIQQEVEAQYGIPIEAVMVGDCPLDDSVSALLAAAREATVNAAKWSGASVISLFAEVEPAQASVVVRDRGRGFDRAAVPADRKGLAESIHGRMTRRGGSAEVSTADGEGTKVTLRMPRGTGRPQPESNGHLRPAAAPDGPGGTDSATRMPERS